METIISWIMTVPKGTMLFSAYYKKATQISTSIRVAHSFNLFSTILYHKGSIILIHFTSSYPFCNFSCLQYTHLRFSIRQSAIHYLLHKLL